METFFKILSALNLELDIRLRNATEINSSMEELDQVWKEER
ncbi:HipB protein (fragment) [Xenorhabdus bovienii str. kraussei Quebec]|uniref:HipB protein n=1 Tax=Xenorhabdus bovienii str. kraussei Quebec TaxID=1398203 RepID=A0A077PFH8_XENBV